MALPDPQTHAEFYADVPTKRLLAWLVDVVIVAFLALLLSALTLFTALLIFPAFYAVVSFLYRWVGLSRNSATIGMRLFSVELRTADGNVFDASTAFLHTAGYFLSVAIFPAQLVSVVLMLLTEKRQGLTDLVLGTAMVNMRGNS